MLLGPVSQATGCACWKIDGRSDASHRSQWKMRRSLPAADHPSVDASRRGRGPCPCLDLGHGDHPGDRRDKSMSGPFHDHGLGLVLMIGREESEIVVWLVHDGHDLGERRHHAYCDI